MAAVTLDPSAVAPGWTLRRMTGALWAQHEACDAIELADRQTLRRIRSAERVEAQQAHSYPLFLPDGHRFLATGAEELIA